jgi:hypothetical protein
MWVLVRRSTSCRFTSNHVTGYHGGFAGAMEAMQRAIEFLAHVAERRF